MPKKSGHYEMHRSGIQVGMKTVSDGWHVRYVSAREEVAVASFWICEKNSAEGAERWAREMVRYLNEQRT